MMFRKWSAPTTWLAATGIIAALLIAASLLINFLTDDGSGNLAPEDTAEGAVQRYILALADDDVAAAYEYVDPALRDTCTLQHFTLTTEYQRSLDFSARVKSTTEGDGNTVVTVEIGESNFDPPFGSSDRHYNVLFSLAEIDGRWVMVEPPWPMSYCPPERIPPTAEATPRSAGLTAISGGNA